MKGVLLIVVMLFGCASSGAEERSRATPVPCDEVSKLGSDPICRIEGMLDAAEAAQKRHEPYDRRTDEVGELFNRIGDPQTRMYLRLRLALVQASYGRMYAGIINEARVDAELIKASSDRGVALDHIKRTERICALRAADFHIGTR